MGTKMTTTTWSTQLATAIQNALIDFRAQIDDQVEMFAIDCHPWNGVLVLAMLTRSETKSDILLADPAEMAAWKHYDFGANLETWRRGNKLTLQMKADYERAGESRVSVAESYLRACSDAVASDVVQLALSNFDRAIGFRISVAHPDSGMEFYSGK
jgi:hypothetical protein